MPDDEDDLTEVTAMRTDSVRGVNRPANGTRWLMLKAADLTECRCAACESMLKADLSTKSINDLPDSAFAYIESGGEKDEEGKTTPRKLRHFPVHDKAHAANALSRAPQSPFGDKAMPKIKAAAKKFGIGDDDMTKADTDMVDCPTCKGKKTIMAGNRDCPDCKDGDGSPTGKVTQAKADKMSKAAGDPGDPDTPGSSTWEAQDAASLRLIATQLADLMDKINVSAQRELTEAQTADPDDYEGFYDLNDACRALECALGIVAAMSFGEAQESASAAQIEAGAMVKAGKRLSAKSKDHISKARDGMVQAASHLTELLGEDDKTGKPGTESEEDVNMEKSELLDVLKDRDAALLKSVSDVIDSKLAERSASADPAAPSLAKAEDAPVTTPAKPAAAPEEDNMAKAEDERIDERITKALAPVEEMVKSLAERVEKFGATPRPGGPALNDLAGKAIQRSQTQTAATPLAALEERMIKAHESGDPYEIEKAGQALTLARLKAGVTAS